MSEFPALKYVGHYQDYSCVTLYQLKNQKKIYSYYFYVFFLPLLYPLSVLMLSYLPPLHLSHALFQFQLFCSNCQAINRLFFDHRAAEKATYSHHKKGEKELKNRATLVCTVHTVQFDIRLYSASRHFPFNVYFTLSQHTLLYLFFFFSFIFFSELSLHQPPHQCSTSLRPLVQNSGKRQIWPADLASSFSQLIQSAIS